MLNLQPIVITPSLIQLYLLPTLS